MFGDIGWAEMMLIGVVALIVIGPQDLPDLFRQLGRFTSKLRQMAREFQRAMDQAASDLGVKDVARDVGNLTSPKAMGLDAVKSAADKFEKWDPLKNAARPTTPTPPGPTPPAGSIAAPPAPAATGSTLTPVSALTPAAPPATPVSPAAAAPAVGPETQALYDKQAARAAILRETTEKLKAVDEAAAAAKPARAPRRKAAPAADPAEAASAPVPAEEAPAKKPRSPRKKKADSE